MKKLKSIIAVLCACLMFCTVAVGCGNANAPIFPDGGIETPVTPPDGGDNEYPDVPPDSGDKEDPDVPPDGGDKEDPDVSPDSGDKEDPDVPPDSGDKEDPDVPPDGGDEEEIGSIAGFDNLALQIAAIDIVTFDGSDITGSPDHTTQVYKACIVSLTNGRRGENFTAATGNVRVRGNNTAGYDKKSYRLKFDQKINLLGLNDGAKCKSWVLLACYKDVTYLRDALVFELAKQTLIKNGYYSSDYAFAEVSVNGVYNGLYLVAEQQQVNKNRVDIAEPDEGYTGNDIGWFIEFDGNAQETESYDICFVLDYKSDGYKIICEDGTEYYPGQIYNFGVASYTVKNDIYATSQRDFIKGYTKNVFKLIYDAIYKDEYATFNADFTALVPSEYTDSKSAIEAVVNIDSMVDTFIIAEIACDNDVDWSSFFFSVDMSATGDKKLTFQAPWDFDSGFGMMRGLENYDKIFSANVSTNAARALNPWLSVFFSADWFKQAVAERFKELEAAGVFDRLIELIDKVTETYESYFARNYEKWDNLGKTVDPVQGDAVETFRTHKQAADWLKDWLERRVSFLSRYFGDIAEK